jgi:hypothetical protein
MKNINKTLKGLVFILRQVDSLDDFSRGIVKQYLNEGKISEDISNVIHNYTPQHIANPSLAVEKEFVFHDSLVRILGSDFDYQAEIDERYFGVDRSAINLEKLAKISILDRKIAELSREAIQIENFKPTGFQFLSKADQIKEKDRRMSHVREKLKKLYAEKDMIGRGRF